MGYFSLSTDMKNRAMELLNDGWTEIEVAEVFGVSVRSLRRWEENTAAKGEVNPRSVLRGHLRILDAAVMEDLWVLESPALYLDEIIDYLAVVHEIHISIIALHNNLQALGLTYRMMQRTTSQRDEQIRQAWRDDVAANFSREQFVFTGESSKDGRTLYRRFGHGYLAVRIVEGSVDGAEFYDFIVNEVNPIEYGFSAIKYYLRRRWRQFLESEFPIVDLAEACTLAVTAEKSEGWFRECGICSSS
ncbi:hypothetical protein PAXINDRAFT_87210 [Paxillus involutus ATCC 200175]|uniref:Uncharacterized protein n=1 Tax=Paxillus involutus ATCC 200175 TaxID=664439 RepID=A0A0C9SQH9_PAXIN|nr:hypothetical protein PAXINDRAFT_87210 [Paxillus involutus ATCC 200175]